MSSEFLASLWKNFHGRGTVRVQTPNYAVGKNFVVCLSTTKTTKMSPPEKYPLYGIITVIREKRSVANILSLLQSLVPVE